MSNKFQNILNSRFAAHESDKAYRSKWAIENYNDIIEALQIASDTVTAESDLQCTDGSPAHCKVDADE